MQQLSTAASTVIRSSHTIELRATATGPLGSSQEVPISGGTVTVDVTSQTRRSGTITIADPSLWPGKPTDLLAPYGAELFVEYGIVVPGLDPFWVPLITGLLSETDITVPADNSQGLTIVLVDRSQYVHDDRLSSPVQVGGGTTTVVGAIRSLITDAYPAANIIDQTGDTTLCPLYTVQQERWTDGVEPLATSIGAECFCDALGNFVIRYQPTLADPIVWQVNTGPQGVLVGNTRQRTRDAVYNQVVVLGTASDGSTPVLATVQDDDPTSPTYYNGPFGHKPRFFQSALVTSSAQALAGADAILTLSTITNPAIDAGDVMSLLGDTGTALHMLDTVTIPLDFTQPQQMVTHATVLPDEQGGTVEQLQ